MTQYNHTPIVDGDSRKNAAAIWNGPMGQLDAAIGQFSPYTGQSSLAAWIAELTLADGAVVATVQTGATVASDVSTTLASGAAAGDMVISVTSSTGITAGEFVRLTLDSGATVFLRVLYVSGSSLTLSQAVPSAAASGNAVTSYKATITTAAGQADNFEAGAVALVWLTGPTPIYASVESGSGTSLVMSVSVAAGTVAASTLITQLPDALYQMATSINYGNGYTPTPMDAIRYAAGDIYNVLAYGADRSGATDTQAEIQAAVDACESGGGGIVLFPPGDYKLSSGQILIDSSKVQISGHGARLLVNDGAGSRIVVARETTDVSVHGLTIVDQTTTGAHDLLCIQNSSRVHVHQVKFLGGGRANYGIGVSQNTDTSSDGACDHIWITECYFENIIQYGIEYFPKAISTGLVITGNSFSAAGTIAASGAAIKAGQTAYNSIISTNVIRQGEIGIIAGNGYESCAIVGNTISDVGLLGIALTITDHSYFGTPEDASKQLLIANNNIGASSAGDTTAYGIQVNGQGTAEGNGPVIIQGNNIWGISRGIVIQPQAVGGGKVAIGNIVVRDNTIAHLASHFYITADDTNGAHVTGLRVLNNTFLDETSGGNVNARVTCHADGQVVVKGNEFYNLGEYALRIYGDNCLVMGNHFLGCNVTGVASRPAILLQDTTANEYQMYQNIVENGASGSVDYLYSTSGSTNPVVKTAGNSLPTGVSHDPGGTSYGTINEFESSFNVGRSRFFVASQDPNTAGSADDFLVGDIVFDSSPSASGKIGWVCVAGGAPGTWKPFGAIDA